MFKVGDKIQCIRSESNQLHLAGIYTVKQLYPNYKPGDSMAFNTLQVEEIEDCWWSIDRFTDIGGLSQWIPPTDQSDGFWSVNKPGYSATVKFNLDLKCTCGTASLHGGGKHSSWCDIKE